MSASPAYILSPTDVRNIRAYVHAKYAAMPGEKRAEIVADAIWRIIDKQLPDFDPPLKRKLIGTLIRTTVLEQQRPVGADDIYRLCMELDRSDERIAGPLQAWLRRQEELLGWGGPETLPEGASAWPDRRVAPSAASRLLGAQRRKRLYIYGALFVLLAAASAAYGTSLDMLRAPSDAAASPPAVQAAPQAPPPAASGQALNELPEELRYAPVERERLLAYLDAKSSLLADAPYFGDIMGVAEQFDIHPALLFAVTGQEQAFVPRTHQRAEEIVNNPFNVFHSWQHFNTTTKESAEIAARTINRLSKDRPPDVDPFVWINREYAEDPNWSAGVRSIFEAIMRHLANAGD